MKVESGGLSEGAIPADFSVDPCPHCGGLVDSYQVIVNHPRPIRIRSDYYVDASTVSDRILRPCGHSVLGVFFDFVHRSVSWTMPGR